MLFFEVDFGKSETQKRVFYLHEKLKIKDPRGQEIHPKIAPKSLKSMKKMCLETLLFLQSFFHHIFSDLDSLLAPFWLNFGNFEARKRHMLSHRHAREVHRITLAQFDPNFTQILPYF